MKAIETNDGLVYVLESDTCIRPKIEAARRLDWDERFNRLPEVERLGPKDVVADVGAFIGDTTMRFVRQGCGDIMAFEPFADAFECLEKNMSGHLYVTTIRTAIGNGRGFSAEGCQGGNMGGRSVNPGDKPSWPLNDLWDMFDRPEFTFLKVDVEGWEQFVLEGAREILGELHPVIAIEINPPALKRAGASVNGVMRILQEHKYQWREYFRYYNENWDLICT